MLAQYRLQSMIPLNDLFDLDSETPSERLARSLADSDSRLLSDLVAMRERADLTQQQLADKLGVTQATISAFERYDNDPKLSTIRRYALGVGALVAHLVEPDNGELDETASFVAMRSNNVHVTTFTVSVSTSNNPGAPTAVMAPTEAKSNRADFALSA